MGTRLTRSTPLDRTTGQPTTCLTTRKDVAVFLPDRHDLPLDSLDVSRQAAERSAVLAAVREQRRRQPRAAPTGQRSSLATGLGLLDGWLRRRRLS